MAQPNPAAEFEAWLKAGDNMKLSSNRTVARLVAEGITDFDSLVDFDKKSIQYLPKTVKETIPQIAEDVGAGIEAQRAIPGVVLSTISVRRLITAVNAADYYTPIGMTMDVDNMNYNNVLKFFKVEWETCYQDLLDQDTPDVPLISDKEGDRKVIKWVSVFQDCLARSYGVHGPLSYVLRDDPEVPAEVDDALDANSYFGESGSMQDELTARLPHVGPIFKTDNCSVFLKIEKASRGTSVESTVKAFSRRKDGRGAYLAFIANHAGDTKYRAILKVGHSCESIRKLKRDMFSALGR